MEKYSLPDLPYNYDALEPVISEKVLRIHHDIHHNGYVTNANNILQKLEDLRNGDEAGDQKALLKGLSFNVGGHLLHSIFWENMCPEAESEEPEGELKTVLEAEFGSVERFKKEFSEAANSTEGSGWAALTFCKKTKRPMIMQVEKHNVNVLPAFSILMVVDVWEHAYYLDYENKRGDFVSEFWKVVNWKDVEKRLNQCMGE